MKPKRFLRLFARLLLEISKKKKKRKKRIAIRLQINQLDTGETNMKNATLNADKKITLTVEALDAKGRPAPVSGAFTWTASASGFVGLFPYAPDNKVCDVTWLAASPSTVITVSGTSMAGVTISEHVDVATLAAAADHLTVTVGPETDL
jgi:uncharacterized lipoprotein NlpE involved in copper resistance